MIKIRKANLKDVPEMEKVLLDAYHLNYCGAGEYYSKEELTDPNYASTSGPYNSNKIFLTNNYNSIKERLNNPFKAFVMHIDKEMVGYIIIEKHLGRTWVNDILITKRYQKKDFGKKLLDFALKKEKNVYLWVNAKNPAQQFWKKEGFKEVLKECLMKR